MSDAEKEKNYDENEGIRYIGNKYLSKKEALYYTKEKYVIPCC
jgi:hypothetical protein